MVLGGRLSPVDETLPVDKGGDNSYKSVAYYYIPLVPGVSFDIRDSLSSNMLTKTG